MTDVAALGARRCHGCGALPHARDRCACDTATVHVITDLGPTDLPGLRVQAQLLGPVLGSRTGGYVFRMPLWYYPAQPMPEET